MDNQNDNLLQTEIVELIRGGGPITFARFMELALYHPRHGFYTRGGGPWGGRRDYVTSVDAGPVFAALMMPLFRACWQSLGSPADYLLVDAGGGDGRFAETVAAEARTGFEPFSSALRPALADRCAAGRASTPEVLERISFPPAAGRSPLGPCCVFANELLDALPVQLVRMAGDRLEEARVTERAGNLELGWSDPVSPELASYFQTLGIALVEGQQAAVNLEAERWIRQAASGIEQGHLVIVDYGYPAPVLFSPETAADPVRTYRAGREGGGPLENPGQQDITAMVDFSSLARWAREAGFTLRCLTDQYRLLQRLAEQVSGDPAAWERLAGSGAGVPASQRLRRGMGLRALLSPEGIGGSFRVMVLSRGVVEPLPLLRGLRTLPGISVRIE